MEETKQRLKIYCETTFWSYLNGGRTPLSHIAVKQALTRQWWQEFSGGCDIFISPYVTQESMRGNPERAELRQRSLQGMTMLDGFIPEVKSLADALRQQHAVPVDEAVDASHIATAAVYGMDILLTWNCRHMANPMTLPLTASVIATAGYRCPIIVTPEEFIARSAEVFHEE